MHVYYVTAYVIKFADVINDVVPAFYNENK